MKKGKNGKIKNSSTKSEKARHGKIEMHDNSSPESKKESSHWERAEDEAKKHFLEGNMMLAEKLLLDAAGDVNAGPTVFHNLGLVREAQGDLQGAIEAYSFSVDEIEDSLINRGLAQEEAGEIEQARLDYMRVLEKNPNSISALVNLGTLELAQGNIFEAKKILEHGFDLDPTVGWQLSDVYKALGDHVKAIEVLKIAAENGDHGARAQLDNAEKE